MITYEVEVHGMTLAELAEFIRENRPNEAQFRRNALRGLAADHCTMCGTTLRSLILNYRTIPDSSSPVSLVSEYGVARAEQYGHGGRCYCAMMRKRLRIVYAEMLIRMLRKRGYRGTFRRTAERSD